MHTFLLFQMPGLEEMLVIAFFGVILFGKRLPEVGRSLGQGIVQFKKGLKGIEDEVDIASRTPTTPRVTTPVLPQSTNELHKFDPISGQPLQATVAVPAGAKFDPFTGKPIIEQTEASASA